METLEIESRDFSHLQQMIIAQFLSFSKMLDFLNQKIRTKDIERVRESIQGLQSEYKSKAETK